MVIGTPIPDSVVQLSRPKKDLLTGACPPVSVPLRSIQIDLSGVSASLHIIDHTSMDTPDLVPASGLENTVQAFAKMIDEVDATEMREVRGDLYP